MSLDISSHELNRFSFAHQHTALLGVLATHQNQKIRIENLFETAQMLDSKLDKLPRGLFILMRRWVDKLIREVIVQGQLSGESRLWLQPLIELGIPHDFLKSVNAA